jgi:CheY-like chemotaxis protein
MQERPPKPPPIPRAGRGDPLAVTPLRVLVVDDNRDSAQTMQMLLEAAGHEVRSVYDGHSAIAAAEAWKPEAVLLDLGLPGMDGYEVAEWLRQMPITARVKLIAMTGYGQEEDRRRTTLSGFDAHLVKPVDMETLGRILKATRHAA